jgi:hypothetical protein
MLFNVPGGISARDGLQSSPFPVSFDDEIADGFLGYALVSSHHLQFS